MAVLKVNTAENYLSSEYGNPDKVFLGTDEKLANLPWKVTVSIKIGKKRVMVKGFVEIKRVHNSMTHYYNEYHLIPSSEIQLEKVRRLNGA